MAISVTLDAANHINNFLTNRKHGIGIRVAVKTTGCSGLAYKLEFVDSSNINDIEFISHNIHIFVDAQNLPYLDGTVLDYKKEQLQEGFEFTNPNVKAKCGCGESFTV